MIALHPISSPPSELYATIVVWIAIAIIYIYVCVCFLCVTKKERRRVKRGIGSKECLSTCCHLCVSTTLTIFGVCCLDVLPKNVGWMERRTTNGWNLYNVIGMWMYGCVLIAGASRSESFIFLIDVRARCVHEAQVQLTNRCYGYICGWKST